MKVVGIMTCYNRKNKTVESINRLLNGNREHVFEFVVTDDNSNDGTVESLSAIPEVTVIGGDGNLFYSGGMRKGIAYVKENGITCDYVLFFNDDVEFYDGIIGKMIAYADGNAEIVVGATESDDGTLSYGGVKKKSKFKPSFTVIMSKDKKEYCDTFCANCVLIPFSVFSELDNIDGKFVHSLGDYDYGLTATEKGYKISVTDFFVGRCNDNPVSQSWLDRTKTRKERLKLKESPKGLPRDIWFYFIKKHYGFISAVTFSLSQYLKILLKI